MTYNVFSGTLNPTHTYLYLNSYDNEMSATAVTDEHEKYIIQ